MGNLARRDQYALPITGGLEQQALARMPAISTNIEDRRPTGPHSFQTQEPVIVEGAQQAPSSWSDVMEQAMQMQRGAGDMTFRQPDKYGFSQSLDERLQGSPPMPHPLQATPVDKFTDYLTQLEGGEIAERKAERDANQALQDHYGLSPSDDLSGLSKDDLDKMILGGM
jgi:hypothetical protein